MSEEEDEEKQFWEALAILKQDMENLKKDIDGLRSLDSRVKKIENYVVMIFGSLWNHVEAKGKQCARVAKSVDNIEYCTAWELRSVPKGFENRYVLIGGRYHPRPGGTTCFSCFSFEKREKESGVNKKGSKP